jgi:hypothetical protein
VSDCAIRDGNIARALADEVGKPERWFWLSFVDDEKPVGSKFIGACMVKARGMATAIREAHRQGCNPGGEVSVTEVPEDRYPKPPWVNRLLTKAEALSDDLDLVLRTPG